MDACEDNAGATQLNGLRIGDGQRWFQDKRGLLSRCPVRPIAVIGDDGFSQEPIQMSAAEDWSSMIVHVTETLATLVPKVQGLERSGLPSGRVPGVDCEPPMA